MAILRKPYREESKPAAGGATERLTGTHLNYLLVCHRKLWLYAHHLEMEQTNDRVALGRQLHETSFSRREKEIMIDNLICIDVLSEGTIHDTKLTRKMKAAHRAQILYYLWYLKKYKGAVGLKGMINYPKQRRSEDVYLTPDAEKEVEQWIAEAAALIRSRQPPEIPEPMPVCRRCSYNELCWG